MSFTKDTGTQTFVVPRPVEYIVSNTPGEPFRSHSKEIQMYTVKPLIPAGDSEEQVLFPSTISADLTERKISRNAFQMDFTKLGDFPVTGKSSLYTTNSTPRNLTLKSAVGTPRCGNFDISEEKLTRASADLFKSVGDYDEFQSFRQLVKLQKFWLMEQFGNDLMTREPEESLEFSDIESIGNASMDKSLMLSF